jgi:multidrug resistance efflux pump
MTMFRSLGRKLIRITPAVVWLLAIGGAMMLFSREHRVGSLSGFAEDRSITIAPTELGRVRELRAELHQFVEPGDILVQFDDRDDQLALATMTTDLEHLRKEIESEASKLQFEEAGLDVDSQDLSRRFLTDRESAHVQYLSALATQAGDKGRLNGLLVEEDILEQLYKETSASFRELNAFKTGVQEVRERVRANEENLARMQKAYQEADARWFAHHDRQKIPYDREAVLAPLHVAVQVKEREILELVHRIDEGVRRAPIRGQITALYVGIGDTVVAGNPMLVISPTSTKRVIAYLPESETATVRVGEKLRVLPVAKGREGNRSMEGRIVSVADAIREAPTRFRRMPNLPVWGREVVIRIEGKPGLIPGEAVSINWKAN